MQTVFRRGPPFYILTNSVWGFLSLHVTSLPTFDIISSFFFFPSGFEMLALICFFLVTIDVEYLSVYLLLICVSYLWNVDLNLLSILKLGSWSSLVIRGLYVFWTQVFLRYMICRCFLTVFDFSFVFSMMSLEVQKYLILMKSSLSVFFISSLKWPLMFI